MSHLLETLVTSGTVVTDGAWGTELQARGLPIGGAPEAWNLEHPDRVEAVARGYAEAGSRVVLTNTFGGNRIALARHGLADRAVEINRAGVELSRRGAGAGAHVFGSIGPSGKVLLGGEVSESDLQAAFEEQAGALAAAGADALVLETMTDLVEARIALEASVATGLPVIASLVFDSGRDHDRTAMGVTPEQAAEELLAAGAALLGSNCGLGIEGHLPVCRRLHAATGRAVWVKANAGLPELVEGRAVYSIGPEEFARATTALVEAGAGFLGGCCGTGPDTIRALAAELGG